MELGIPDSNDFEKRELYYGDRYRVKPGVVHRFCAPEHSSVTLIEVSTAEINDVVRLEDDYKRV